MRRKLLKITGGFMISLVVLAIVGWIAFVPSPQGPGYEFAMAWGSKGSGPGQFRDPTGLAVAGNEVFVADARNGRIQVFDFNGKFKREFGKPGKKPGEMKRPMNLRIVGNELYVAEYWNDRIQVFGLDGTSHRIIGGRSGSGPGQLNAPGGIAVAANGDLLVADFYNQRIQRLTADGHFIRQWGTTKKVGIGAGQFNYPTDVALAKDGTIYVGDGYNDRVQAFKADGSFWKKWGGPFAMNIFGPFRGWFTTVTSVALDPTGNVFVADFYNNRVQKFTRNGSFLTAFGAKGKGPGQFTHVTAVAVADDGTVFVADFGNNRVQKWVPKR